YVPVVAILPDGTSGMSAGIDAVRFWNLPALSLRREVPSGTRYFDDSNIVFTPDGRSTLLNAGVGPLRMCDSTTGKMSDYFGGHGGGTRSIAISPDGRAAISGGGDRLVRLYDLANIAAVRSFAGHGKIIKGVGFRADGQVAYSADAEEIRTLD